MLENEDTKIDPVPGVGAIGTGELDRPLSMIDERFDEVFGRGLSR